MRERRRFEDELDALRAPVERELDERELEGAGDKGTGHRCIVLVAGCEYPRFNEKPSAGKKWFPKNGRLLPERSGGASHWRQKCLDLAEHKLRRSPGTTVVLFDLDRGTKETVRLAGKKRVVEEMPGFTRLPMVGSDYRVMNLKTRELATLSNVGIPAKDPFVDAVHVAYCPHISELGKGPVKLADWVAWLKKNNKLGHPGLGLGIEHVYDHVEAIGKSRPGQLAELHLFGHASSSHDDANGTAFVNTWEWRGAVAMPSNKRSPLDLDARAHVDFLGRTPSFAKAFAPDAFSQVWGCNWHVPDHALLYAVRGALKGKALDDGGPFDIPIGLTKLRPAEFERMFTHPFEKSAKKPVQAAPGSINAKKTLWSGLTAAWVRAYYAALLDRTYMKALARASGRRVLGGLPATYSDYDVQRHGGEPKLSHIPMGKALYTGDASPQNFLGVMLFFQKNYQTTFGPGAHKSFGRGFAWYDP